MSKYTVHYIAILIVCNENKTLAQAMQAMQEQSQANTRTDILAMNMRP